MSTEDEIKKILEWYQWEVCGIDSENIFGRMSNAQARYKLKLKMQRALRHIMKAVRIKRKG